MEQDTELKNVYERDMEEFPPGTTYNIAFKAVEENDTVLEIGCATGYWGKYTKKHKPNAEIYGLDYLDVHVERAKETNCYKEVLQYDLNKADESLDRFKQKFDKIVILDVLEHLYDPKKVLMWLRNFMKLDGKIIISVPNVGHKSIIHQLLLGQFNYTPEGLLDRTHIRFFTGNSFSRVLTEASFKILQVMRIQIPRSPYEQYLPPEINNYINSLPESNSFEYIFIATPME